MRTSSPLSVLKNKGTSKVFFYICKEQGKSFPSEIAKRLELSLAGVKAQLNRLEWIKLIYFEKQEGRFRKYAVDWERLAELTIVKYKKESMLMHLTECGVISSKVKKDEVIALLDKVRKNPDFTIFIKEFFIELSQNDNVMPETIEEALDNLESHHLDYFKENRTESSLEILFKKWADYNQRHNFDTFESYKIALKKTANTSDQSGQIERCFKKIEEQNNDFSKTLIDLIEKPNLINFDLKDIKNALRKGDIYTFIKGTKIPQHKAKDVKAAIIVMIVNEKITLDEISSIAEKIVNELDDDAEVLWAAKIVPQQPQNQILTLLIK